MSHCQLKSVVFVLLAMMLIGSSVMADTVDVSIVSFSFSPQSIAIFNGTTVRWTNQDAVPHTSTSDSDIWDSGNLAQFDTWSYTFDSVGTFPYHCEVHPSMLGTVVVNQSTHIPSSTHYGLIILAMLIVVSTVMILRKKRVTA